MPSFKIGPKGVLINTQTPELTTGGRSGGEFQDASGLYTYNGQQAFIEPARNGRRYEHQVAGQDGVSYARIQFANGNLQSYLVPFNELRPYRPPEGGGGGGGGGGATKSAIASDPSTPTIRGALIPLLLGKLGIGAVVGWVGNREDRAGTWYESAMHILCIGPAEELTTIYSNGYTTWRGNVTRTTHPSGTLVDIGTDGKFRIYWGDAGQPINTELAGFTELDSSYPSTCYIYWEERRLGESAYWPTLHYEVTADVRSNSLTSDSSYISTNEYEDNANIGRHTEFVWKTTDAEALNWQRGYTIEVSAADYRATIASSPFESGGVYYIPVTTSISGSIVGLQPGVITGYMKRGVNPADLIDQVLFDPWPHGGGLRPDTFDLDTLTEVHDHFRDGTDPSILLVVDGGFPDGQHFLSVDTRETYTRCQRLSIGDTLNMTFSGSGSGTKTITEITDNEDRTFSITIDIIGVGTVSSTVALSLPHTGTETMASSILLKGGDSWTKAITALQEDFGLMVSFNTFTGLFEFSLMREGDAVTTITQDEFQMQNVVRQLGYADLSPAQTVYSLVDNSRKYSSSTVSVTDDGLSRYQGSPNSQKIDLNTITDLGSATEVASRKEQESDMDETINVRLQSSLLRLPIGSLVDFENIPDRFRLLEREYTPEEASFEGTFVKDAYSITNNYIPPTD